MQGLGNDNNESFREQVTNVGGDTPPLQKGEEERPTHLTNNLTYA